MTIQKLLIRTVSRWRFIMAEMLQRYLISPCPTSETTLNGIAKVHEIFVIITEILHNIDLDIPVVITA